MRAELMVLILVTLRTCCARMRERSNVLLIAYNNIITHIAPYVLPISELPSNTSTMAKLEVSILVVLTFDARGFIKYFLIHNRFQLYGFLLSNARV